MGGGSLSSLRWTCSIFSSPPILRASALTAVAHPAKCLARPASPSPAATSPWQAKHLSPGRSP